MTFAALESVYRAKLWGALSWLLKIMVTLAPAGTLIEDLSKAIFWAVRLIVTGAAAVDEAAGAVVEGGTNVVAVELEAQAPKINITATKIKTNK